MNEAANFVDGQANEAQVVTESIADSMTIYPGQRLPNVKSL